jgi:hypothetical protein
MQANIQTKAPNSKFQAPEKSQTSNSKSPGNARGGGRISSVPLTWRMRVNFGPWTLMFIWILELGIWSFSAPSVLAQAPAPPPQDPFIPLMLSQPRIDIASPVEASAAFDPPVVRPGESSTYRVTFNALEESIAWPSKLTLPANFEMRPGAHGQIFQMAGLNTMVPLTTFNYHLRSSNPGDFTVPEFVVQVYGRPVRVPAARLEVSSTPATSAPPSLHLMLEIPRTNPFVGEPVSVRVLLPGAAGGVIQGLAQVQLSGEGFLVDQGTAQQRFESIMRGSYNVTIFIHETTLTPITTGKLSVLAQGFTAATHFLGMIQGPGTILGVPQYTLLDSEPVELEVRPLPREGELPGFTGAIGSFSLDVPTLATNAVRVGDPVKLTVTVHGNNLARLVAPPPPTLLRDWQVFSATSDGAPPQFIQMRGFATFNYTLIPLTEQTRATPAIPFSCFDPQRGRYMDLTIPPIPVTVTSGPIPADAHLLLQTGLDASEKEPVLSGLAPSPGRTARSLVPVQQNRWFPFLQLLPAAAFLGLWNWDRRRRYLEHHPDIVLRRRARRALRREWRTLRQAARIGDVESFAMASVNAMRVACAPHYPAEPRALVGSDVLQVLSEPTFHEPERRSPTRCDPNTRQDAGSETGAPITLMRRHRTAQASADPGNGEPIPNYAPSFQAHEDRPNNWDKTSEVVRRFFAVTDATRFDTDTPDSRELLSLQQELEGVLEELEARL